MNYCHIYKNNYQIFNSLADIELNLIDGSKSVPIRLHKIVLMQTSTYFFSMFKNNWHIAKIDIYTQDAETMKSVILSLYGIKYYPDYPQWKFLLHQFICRNSLCLNTKVYNLYSLKVPPSEFNLLLSVLQLCNINTDTRLIRLLINNLPLGYDLDTLPYGYKTLLGTVNNQLCAFINDTNYVQIYDTFNKSHMNLPKKFALGVKHIEFSKDNNFLLVLSESQKNGNNRCIRIFSFYLNKFITKLRLNDTDYVTMSPGCKFLAWDSYSDKEIKIWHIGEQKILNEIKYKGDYVSKIKFSHCCSMIAVILFNYGIKLWDIREEKLIMEMNSDEAEGEFTDAIFSQNDETLIMNREQTTIDVYSIKTRNEDTVLSIKTPYPDRIKFSSDEKTVAYYTNKFITIYDIETVEILQMIPNLLFEPINNIHSISLDCDMIFVTADDSISIYDTKSGIKIGTVKSSDSTLLTLSS